MRNHDQKIKDMSRSVLPSTGRVSARLMPDTLIGRHAVQHIEWALERHEQHARFTASRTADRGRHIADMDRQLRQILETGLHANLNAAMRLLADIQPTAPWQVTAFRPPKTWSSSFP